MLKTAEPETGSQEDCVSRLLLVDDEDDFRETAADYFRRRGLNVTAVESGEKALQAIRGSQFDVVVLDVHMPEMDGVTLLPKLLEEDDELQVLMLTGGRDGRHCGRIDESRRGRLCDQTDSTHGLGTVDPQSDTDHQAATRESATETAAQTANQT